MNRKKELTDEQKKDLLHAGRAYCRGIFGSWDKESQAHRAFLEGFILGYRYGDFQENNQAGSENDTASEC